MAKIQGHIERITFLSEENGFCVCKLKVKGEQNLVTIVGNMVNPVPGEFVELDGNWGIHAKFGNQFQVKTYTTLVPATQHSPSSPCRTKTHRRQARRNPAPLREAEMRWNGRVTP